jgi:hypothetical protein
MKVIFPCAGRSSRYPGLKPKYLLTCPDGSIMLQKVIEGMRLKSRDVIITILKEHENRYGVKKGLRKIFGRQVKIVLLKKLTSSVVETVEKTLEEVKIKDDFMIKDCDSYFNMGRMERSYNYLCAVSLDNLNFVRPANKSYVVINEQKNVIDIAEKKVISNIFSVGGYYFKNPRQFLGTYHQIKSQSQSTTELYISHIIKYLIARKEVFRVVFVKNYLDWGTAEDWFNWISRHKVYFIDVDGIVFYNTGRYFGPTWENAQPIKENIERINQLYNSNNQIFLVTSRPEIYRKITERQLVKYKVKCHKLIMGCLHARRVLINDFAITNKFPSAEAVNIIRDSNKLSELI